MCVKQKRPTTCIVRVTWKSDNVHVGNTGHKDVMNILINEERASMKQGR